MPIFFLEGFLAGLIVSMPMGAIGMLCLRYILVQGKRAGFSAGLGIATADALAAGIGSLGLTAITQFLNNHEIWTHSIGSFILISFGLFLLFSKTMKTHKHTERGFVHIFLIMLTITLTNPLTLISFTGIFASLGLDAESYLTISVLALGVFLGSLSWWVTLILASYFFNITARQARVINEIAGSLLIILGIFSLATLTSDFLL